MFLRGEGPPPALAETSGDGPDRDAKLMANSVPDMRAGFNEGAAIQVVPFALSGAEESNLGEPSVGLADFTGRAHPGAVGSL